MEEIIEKNTRPVSCANCGAPLQFEGKGFTNRITCTSCSTENYLTKVLFNIDPPRRTAGEVIDVWENYRKEQDPRQNIEIDRLDFQFLARKVGQLFENLKGAEIKELIGLYGMQKSIYDITDSTDSVLFITKAIRYGLPDKLMLIELVNTYVQATDGPPLPNNLQYVLNNYFLEDNQE